LYWIGAWPGAQAGAHPGAQVVAQLTPQDELFFLKQSKRLHFFFGWVAQAGAQPVLHAGPQTEEGAQPWPQEDFLHLKQSKRPFLGAEPQPAGAQLVGPQTGLQAGPQFGAGAQLVEQAEDFLHLKQSNRPFLGAEPQPEGAQLVGLVQIELLAGPQCPLGPQLGPQVVAQLDDFLPLRQSKRLHFFFGWVAQATGGLQDFVVAHPLSQ
jgi:hypothetical protein